MLYLIKKKRHFSSAVDPPRAFQFLGFLVFFTASTKPGFKS